MQPNITEYYGSALELQVLTDFAHAVPGIVVCVIALLFLFSELGYKRKQISTFYSIVFMAMPVSFISYILFGHGLQNTIPILRLIITAPEVYLHIFTLIGNLIGGIGEISYVRGKIKAPLGALLFPVLFLMDGYLSILHPHGSHGHGDIFHNLYGSIMVLTGLLMITARLIQQVAIKKYFIYATAFTMFIAGAMLVSYSEPDDSFQNAFFKQETADVYYPDQDKLYIYLTETGVFPKEIQVKIGTEIIFTKLDDILLDLESGPHPAHDAFPALNVGRLDLYESKSVVMNQIGDFGFHDHVNPDSENFTGSIKVIESPSSEDNEN